jgi:hypothetical protein
MAATAIISFDRLANRCTEKYMFALFGTLFCFDLSGYNLVRTSRNSFCGIYPAVLIMRSYKYAQSVPISGLTKKPSTLRAGPDVFFSGLFRNHNRLICLGIHREAQVLKPAPDIIHTTRTGIIQLDINYFAEGISSYIDHTLLGHDFFLDQVTGRRRFQAFYFKFHRFHKHYLLPAN